MPLRARIEEDQERQEAGPVRTETRARWVGVEAIEELAPEWLDMCYGGPGDEPFVRPEFIAALLRSFAPSSPVLLLEARVGGVLGAVVALMRRRMPFGFRKLLGTANVHSCRFDIVRSQKADGDAAVEALWEALKAQPHWDCAEFPRVAEGGTAEQFLAMAARDGYRIGRWPGNQSPFITVETSALEDPSRLAKNAHFRQNLRRRIRKAQSTGTLTFKRITAYNAEALNAFFELEKRGWKGQAASAIACDPAETRFYTDLAKNAAAAGYLSLYFLELDGVAIAAHFGLTYRGTYYSPKVAYDEKHSALGPGHLIVHEILRDLAARGITKFDFLGPDMPWKAEWASGIRPHSFCYVFQKGLRGRLLHFVHFGLMLPARDLLQRHPVAARVVRKLKGALT